jgi:heat shock protein HslJ
MKTTLLIVPLILLLFSSCGGSVEHSERDKIFNKTLVLAELDSVKYAENEKSGEIYIKLTRKEKNKSKGEVQGFAGCNNIFGTFISNEGIVPKFSLVLTEKFCDKAEMERKLVELLNNLNMIEVQRTDITYFYSDTPRHKAMFKIVE